MKNSNISKLILLVLITLIYSCATVHYPNSVNMPLHMEEGETQIEAAVNFSSLTVKGSHSISDNFAISAGYNVWGWSYSVADVPDAANGMQFQVMPGYYSTIGKDGHFEIFGGYGISYVNRDVRQTYQQIILQPAIGFKSHNNDLAFGVRSSYYPGTGVFIDPAFMWRTGGERLKFTSQFGMSFGNKPDLQSPTLLIINIGLQYTFRSKKVALNGTPSF